MSKNYKDYLQLGQILSTQKISSDVHDEMLFIVTHQAHELWFKQLIHEFDYLKHCFRSALTFEAQSTLKRIIKIFGLLHKQLDILWTMLPSSFASFRENLGTASGIQSFQFRELEFLLGFKNQAYCDLFPSDSMEWRVLNRRLAESTVFDEFILACKNDLLAPNIPLGDLQSALPCITKEVKTESIFHFLYKERSIYTELAELLLDVDSALQDWRYYHVKTVIRIIGDKTMGTAKTTGMHHLKETLFHSFCQELWDIRNKVYTSS